MHLLWLEIETERTWPVAAIGPAFISSYVRKHGHEASLLRVTPDTHENAVADRIAEIHPDVLGLSLTIRQWLRARQLVGFLRAHLDIPVLAGGSFPSFHSAEVLASPGFDFVCVGEGEVATLELLVRLERGEPPTGPAIRNIRARGGPPPPLRPPIANLDALPFPARDILDEVPTVAHVSTARGCPFICAHCSARTYRDLYGHLERFHRRRSAGSVLSELEAVQDGMDVHYVVFTDNVFNDDNEWLQQFLLEYPRRVGKPFSIRARAETMNQALLEDLARAGCQQIAYQVGSGSWRVRQEVLRRPVSSHRLVRTFEWTREAGIAAIAGYVIGLPGETRHDLEATFQLHEQLRPFDFDYEVFYPFPGTPLFRLCREKGYLPKDYLDRPANHRASVLDLPELSKDDIAQAYARFTRLRERTIKARHDRRLTPALQLTIERQVREMAARG